MQVERRAGPMTAGQSPGGGNLRRMLDEFKRLLNISLSAFFVCGFFVSVLCRYAIPAGGACAMMTGGPRPGCATVAPGPGAAGRREGTMGGVAEKAAASLGMGGEYSNTSPRTLPGYRKIAGVVLRNPALKLSGSSSGLPNGEGFFLFCFLISIVLL